LKPLSHNDHVCPRDIPTLTVILDARW
jgi:hypothetical protein